MCKGIRDQHDAEPMANLSPGEAGHELGNMSWVLSTDGIRGCVSLPEGGYYFWDDVNGKILDWEGIRKARQDEIAFVKKMKLYEIRPVSECYARTGKAPIRTRWVDTDGRWQTPVEGGGHGF